MQRQRAQTRNSNRYDTHTPNNSESSSASWSCWTSGSHLSRFLRLFSDPQVFRTAAHLARDHDEQDQNLTGGQENPADANTTNSLPFLTRPLLMGFRFTCSTLTSSGSAVWVRWLFGRGFIESSRRSCWRSNGQTLMRVSFLECSHCPRAEPHRLRISSSPQERPPREYHPRARKMARMPCRAENIQFFQPVTQRRNHL